MQAASKRFWLVFRERYLTSCCLRDLRFGSTSLKGMLSCKSLILIHSLTCLTLEHIYRLQLRIQSISNTSSFIYSSASTTYIFTWAHTDEYIKKQGLSSYLVLHATWVHLYLYCIHKQLSGKRFRCYVFLLCSAMEIQVFYQVSDRQNRQHSQHY